MSRPFEPDAAGPGPFRPPPTTMPQRKAVMLPSPLLALLLVPGLASAADDPRPATQAPTPAKTPQKAAAAPKAASAPKAPAVPAGRIRAPKGFRVELLYSVPRQTQGSWVNMTVDPKGRLIVSDQYGKLYRVTLPPISGKAEDLRVEPIDAPIGEAQGLLWAFDSLYVVVNRGRSVRQRAVPRPRHQWRRSARPGRAAAQDRRRRRARAARGDPGPRRPVALRRGGQRHPGARDRRVARAPGLGGGQPPAPDGRRQRLHGRTRRHPAGSSAASAPTARPGTWSRSGSATRSTSRSTATASCSRTTPTWSGT